MRCYQERGLTNDAMRFLLDNVNMIHDIICPKCSEVITKKMEILSSEHHDSFYGDGPTLHTYILKDGRVCKEILQAEPWSSGPVAFFCLEIDGVKMFEWSEKEIDDA